MMCTYRRSSAFQLGVAYVNHVAALAANRHRGVGAEAKALHRQQRPAWGQEENKWKVSFVASLLISCLPLDSPETDLLCCQREERRTKRSAGRWSTSCFLQRSGRFPEKGSWPALGRCRRRRCQACTSGWCLECGWCDQANYNQQTGRLLTAEGRQLLTGDQLDVAFRVTDVDGGVFMGEASSSDNQ